MKPKASAQPPKTKVPKVPKVPAVAPEVAPDPEFTPVGEERGRVVGRPDGYHWVTLDDKREFGPFETREEAQADMDAGGDNEESEPFPAETLQEAERDLGIADWIDAETGEPAEGQSRPHLDEQ